MFTGLIQTLGTVESFDEGKLCVACSLPGDFNVGQSIAVNGVCLSATRLDTPRMQPGFCADLSTETFEKTNARRWQPGTRVNLECPLRLNSFVGGHLVQGHVDGVATIETIEPLTSFRRMSITISKPLRPYLIEKGSITLDGVSLTINRIYDESFDVMLIPETLAQTTLGDRRPGDLLNIEVDMLGKYVVQSMKGIL